MSYDLAIDLNGDLMFGSNRDLLGVSGDALNAQRIRVRLRVPRGEWVLDVDGTLGSRLESLLSTDGTKVIDLAPIYVDEALRPMDDVEVTEVNTVESPDTRQLQLVVGYRTIPTSDEAEDAELIPDDPDRPDETVTVSF